MTYPNAIKVMTDALVGDTHRLLALCTEQEQKRFRELIPSIEGLVKTDDVNDLMIAHALLIRTLIRNNQGDQV